MAKDVVNLVLRLPKSLHSRLKQDAVRSGNSLNSEIISQLEHYGPELERATADLKRSAVRYDRLLADLRQLAAKAPTPDQINEIAKTSVQRALEGLEGALFVRATKESGEVMTLRRTKEGAYEVVSLAQEQKEREELARQVRELARQVRNIGAMSRESAPAKDQPAQPISHARRLNDAVAPSPSRSGAARSEVKTKTPA